MASSSLKTSTWIGIIVAILVVMGFIFIILWVCGFLQTCNCASSNQSTTDGTNKIQNTYQQSKQSQQSKQRQQIQSQQKQVQPKNQTYTDNHVLVKFSSLLEPMISVEVGGTRTYAVFDTGSSAFWIAADCVGSCKTQSSSLGPFDPTLQQNHFFPLPSDSTLAMPTCPGGVCAYGSCSCQTADCQKLSCGTSCSVDVSKKVSVLCTVGQTTVCVPFAAGAGKGNASECGGILGILGAGDFLVTSDTENFLFNYFWNMGGGAGFPAKNFAYSFTSRIQSNFQLALSVCLGDTNQSGLSWMKRYVYPGSGMPFIVVRLLGVKSAGQWIKGADPNSFSGTAGNQMCILDTGTALGGSWHPTVQSVITPSLKAAADLEFIFEGTAAGQQVSWPFSARQYLVDMNTLQASPPAMNQASGTAGSTNIFLCDSDCAPPMSTSQAGNWSLLGNLFLTDKRLFVDFGNTRAGVEVLGGAARAAWQRPGAAHLAAIHRVPRPPWVRRPIIPTHLQPPMTAQQHHSALRQLASTYKARGRILPCK